MAEQAGANKARLWPNRMLSFCASALHSVVLPAAQPPLIATWGGEAPTPEDSQHAALGAQQRLRRAPSLLRWLSVSHHAACSILLAASMLTRDAQQRKAEYGGSAAP